MESKQVSVGIESKDGIWIVSVGESGTITPHTFSSEKAAREFARKEEDRLGLS